MRKVKQISYACWMVARAYMKGANTEGVDRYNLLQVPVQTIKFINKQLASIRYHPTT